LISASIGDAIFVGSDNSSIEVGAHGLSGLIAYPGPNPIESLLQSLGRPSTHSTIPVELTLPQPTGFIEVQT
jgi:mannose-6-phosphate isomerase